MIDEMIVQKIQNAVTLCKHRAWGNIDLPSNDLSGLTSTMICDIFGGEILKKRHNNGWHFYNKIDMRLIDFLAGETDNTSEKNNLQDLPALPLETYEYFELEDYLSFYIEFIVIFEEEVGLDYNPPSVSRTNLYQENKA